jgi:hypothetical protein
MVSAGGLKESEGCWIASLYFNRYSLMPMWRYAVIMYLRAALKNGLLASEGSAEKLRVELKKTVERWWNVHVDHVKVEMAFPAICSAVRSTTTDR